VNRRTVLAGGTGIAAVAAAAWWLPAWSADPGERLRATRGGRLLIDVRVDGHPVEALLDSAAETTLLDRAFAQSIGLMGGSSVVARGSGQQDVEATAIEGVTLEAVGRRLPDRTVAVLDLSDVGSRLLGHPLNVILGREVFDAARLRIDVAGLTIAALNRQTDPPGVRLALQMEKGIETVPVRVEGGSEVRAAFDLGNGGNVLLGAAFVQRAGLLDGRTASQERGGGIGGETARRVIQLNSLEVAGRTFEDVPASIETRANANDVNLGISILRHFLITTDFRDRAVWLELRE
jgi:predicted aspartyl protease